jgi:hypothetical protein
MGLYTIRNRELLQVIPKIQFERSNGLVDEYRMVEKLDWRKPLVIQFDIASLRCGECCDCGLKHKSCLKLFYGTVLSNKELLVLAIRNDTSHEIVYSESCQLISDLKRIYNPRNDEKEPVEKTSLPAGEMFWTEDTEYVAELTNSMNVGIKWSFKTTSKVEEKELEQLISILFVWNNGQGVTKIQVLPSSTTMAVKETVCNLGQIPYELPNQFELLLVGEPL